ncbi:MAG: hypothetical protein WD557_08435 [Dehalococcoidia bacterium]
MASPARRRPSAVDDEYEPIFRTPEETKAYFAELVEHDLGMTVEGFFRRIDAGELRDSEAPELQGVWMWHHFFDDFRP